MGKAAKAKKNNKTNPKQPKSLAPIELDEIIVPKKQPDKSPVSLKGAFDVTEINELRGFSESELPPEVVKEVFGDGDMIISEVNLKKYLDYLQTHLQLPCEVICLDIFDWEFDYLIDDVDESTGEEYEKLKLTNPSHTDTFKLLRLESFNVEDGIMVETERIGDKLKFIVPLVNLETIYDHAPNSDLIYYYGCWFDGFPDEDLD